MPTRMVHMVVDAADPARMARFWAAALGWEMTADGPEAANVLPPGYSYPAPVAQLLVVLSVPEAKSAKNRVHLNLATRSVAHQAAEVDRVLDPRPVYRDTGSSPHADRVITARGGWSRWEAARFGD